MKIVLTGGGTAGHIMPNIALLPELKKYFEEIHYIGTNGMEKRILSTYPEVKFHEIDAVKLIRKLTAKNLLIPFKLFHSINESKKILNEIKPDVVFSKGGYVSIPTVIAASKLKIPVVSHESDLTMGLANKIIYRYSNCMLTTFESTAKNKKKCVCTGTPIREQIFNGNKDKINFDFKNSKPNILVFGGSLGAKKINDFLTLNANEICKAYNIIHITGKGKKTTKFLPKNYHQVEFVQNIEDYFDFADVVVTRGGANAVFELLAINKPMLIIPLPKEESRGDQIENANYFKEKKFAEVLEQNNLNLENFYKNIDFILKNKEKIINYMKKNKINNNKKIVEIILKNIKKQ